MKSIGEAVAEGAEAVKDAGARALSGISGSESTKARSGSTKAPTKKKASSLRASSRSSNGQSSTKTSASRGGSTAAKAKASKSKGVGTGSGSKSKLSTGKVSSTPSASSKKTKTEDSGQTHVKRSAAAPEACPLKPRNQRPGDLTRHRSLPGRRRGKRPKAAPRKKTSRRKAVMTETQDDEGTKGPK